LRAARVEGRGSRQWIIRPRRARWDHRVFPRIVIFLVYAMHRPLQGAVSVPPDSFQSVYDLLMKWDEPA